MSSWGFHLDSLMFQFLFNAACKRCYILWMTTAFFNECFKWVNDLTPMVSNFNQQNVSCSGRWSSIWGGWSWLIVNEKPSKSSIYWMRKGVTQLCLECGNLLLKTIPSVTHGKLSREKGAQLPSRTPILWIDEHQRIPGQLTDSLSHRPVLAHPDSELVFVLHVDASEQMQCINKRMEKWGPLLMALELSLLLNKITIYNQGN